MSLLLPAEEAAGDFALKHWPKLALAAVLLLLGIWLGWRLRGAPPPCPSCAPAVQAKVEEHKAKDVDAKKDVEEERGPTSKVKLTFDPHCPPPSPAAVAKFAQQLAAPAAQPYVPQALGSGILLQPPPPGLLSAEITTSGPSERKSQAETETHATEDHHLELAITPPPAGPALPRFSLGWEPRVLPTVGLGRVDAGVRVTERVWLKGWVDPTAPACGAGAEWTW